MKRKIFSALMITLLFLLVPAFASAEDGFTVTVDTKFTCDAETFMTFIVAIQGGTGPYTVMFDYGDGELYSDSYEVAEFNVDHTYPSHGDFAWSLVVEDSLGQSVEAEGMAVLDGPEVTLTSNPWPPLLTLEGGTVSASFTAEVTGDTDSYTYEWDLDGDGLPDEGFEGATADYTYTESGYFKAEVRVTDDCGFVETEKLPVRVVDPEENPEEACHPTAQKIAEAVNGLFPDQTEDLYTCKDIFDIFEGGLTGYQLGFGRMWHAYQLSQTIEELTWEQILDWQLNNGGWGLLTQLDRYGDLLEEYSIVDLIAFVASEEYSMNDVRSAVRAVTRYDAELTEALTRINKGASPGELGQFYKLAQDLEEDPAVLDSYLEDHSLADLRHSAKFAERMGADWTEITEAHAAASSWGDLNQAYRLANDEISAQEILDQGVQEFRAAEREEDRAARAEERDENTAQKLAERYEVELDDVLASFNSGICQGNWGCVRRALRNQEQTQAQGTSDKDNRTAQQIVSKYGVSENEVMTQFASCGFDWACTRAHFRNQARPESGKQDK